MEGIIIPTETVFIAAEHVTTTDQLRTVYVPEPSKTARKAFEQIQAILPKMREEASADRVKQLPNIGCKEKIRRLRLSDLQKIGARCGQNGDLHVMPALLLGIVSLLKTVI